MKIALDACSLIYIAKANLIDLLEKLDYEYFIDNEVYEEVVKTGKSKGYADAYYIDYIINRRKLIKVYSIDISPELNYFIGKGEASTYILSKEMRTIAVTSDRKAYHKLLNRGIHVIQMDMLLFHEFKNRKISKEDFKRSLRLLISVGGTTPKRVLFLLSKIKEE